jgi:hypothetical protein
MSLAFGSVVTGTTATLNTLLTNVGSQALTFNGVTPPTAPFSVTSAPATNSMLAPNASVALSVQFAPASGGNFTGSVTLQSTSTGGPLAIPLTGTSGTAPVLVIAPLALDFGDVAANTTRSMSFTVSNTGGTTLTITKSKPPVAGVFVATTTLAEGTTMAPGTSLTETVSITPTGPGSFSDVWTINGNDGGAARVVTFTATSGMADAASSAGDGALSPAPGEDASDSAGMQGTGVDLDASGSGGMPNAEGGPAVQGAGPASSSGCGLSSGAAQGVQGAQGAGACFASLGIVVFARRRRASRVVITKP